MAKVFIAYASRTNKTKKIAQVLKEIFEEKGHEADMCDCKEVENAGVLENYDILLFGSATYHGDMMQPMKTFLFLAEKANLKDKIGGAFGSYGWSGEAPQRIHDTMEAIFGMKMPAKPLKVKQVGQKPENLAPAFVDKILSAL